MFVDEGMQLQDISFRPVFMLDIIGLRGIKHHIEMLPQSGGWVEVERRVTPGLNRKWRFDYVMVEVEVEARSSLLRVFLFL